MIHLDTKLTRLLAQPLVYATVVRADSKQFGKDGGVNVVIAFDGRGANWALLACDQSELASVDLLEAGVRPLRIDLLLADG